MSQPIQISIVPTQETRMGRMLAAGRLAATMTSKKTGVHMTVEFISKTKGEYRWQNSSFAEATHVFISGGRGNKVATYYPQKGKLYYSTDDKAWQFAVWGILLAAQNGEQTTAQFDIVESDHCGRCGLELTDPVSIARGLGPHCADMETGSTHYKAEKAPVAAPVVAEEATYQEDNYCDGHESTYGPIGNVVYCDGSCKKPERLEGLTQAEIAMDRKGRVLPSTFAELAARVG